MQSTSATSAPGIRRIGNFQKICDALDWSDPTMAATIAGDLGASPSFHRRQWEFATILSVLAREGMLTRSRTGISFGAGREPLTHIVSRKAGRITATDLYSADTVWDVARTDAPRAFVLGPGAPPHEPDRISVERMDMRNLAAGDETFDFAYSTGAIEHIGDFDDFERHFTEVRRVLKPGGVYVFTTVLAFSSTTIRLPNQYYFHPRELAECVARSPLQMDPVFDGRLSPNVLNRPTNDRFLDFGLTGLSRSTPQVTIERGGDVTVANSVILRRGAGPMTQLPDFAGWDASAAFVERSLRESASRVWTTGAPLDVTTGRLRRGAERGAGAVAFGSRPIFFGGPGRVSVMIWLDAARSSSGAMRLEVRSIPRGWPKTPQVVAQVPLDFGRHSGAPERISFEAEPTTAYEILGIVETGGVTIHEAHAIARYAA
jgi:hypothetical protein